jgi:energy-coupling factor transport system permease protein
MPALDSRAWIVWVAGMTTAALTTLHPIYLVLLLGIVVLLWDHSTEDARAMLRFGTLVRIAIYALVFSAVFNMLTVHHGQRILFRLPDALPIIGGALTLESLLYGGLNALRIVVLIFAFSLFSRRVDAADLLRLMPAALFEVGLILSIGFTMIPAALRSYTEIREAQTLRGHEPRGIRGLLPLFTPLVVSGMERALSLAESMESRGYGRKAHGSGAGQWATFTGVAGLLITFGVNTFAPMPSAALIVALVSCAALVGVGLWVLSHAAGRTAWRRGVWGWREWLVTFGVLIVCAVILLGDPSALVFDPYNMRTLPTFDPLIGCALLCFALPAVIGTTSGANHDPR